MKSNTRFARQQNIVPQKKIFVFAEGKETEPFYFEVLNKFPIRIILKTIPKGGSPLGVLKKIKQFVEKNELESDQELWAVIDRDDWEKAHINELQQWLKNKGHQFGFVLSNPCFEQWLIMHYPNKRSFVKSKACKKYFENSICSGRWRKVLSALSEKEVKTAVTIAKREDTSSQNGWPLEYGQSTVYKLVNKYLKKN